MLQYVNIVNPFTQHHSTCTLLSCGDFCTVVDHAVAEMPLSHLVRDLSPKGERGEEAALSGEDLEVGAAGEE